VNFINDAAIAGVPDAAAVVALN